MEDLPKLIAQMRALLPALQTTLAAPTFAEAVEAASGEEEEGILQGEGFGPAGIGGNGKGSKVRASPYSQ